MGATTQCFVWVQDFSGAAFHQPRVELAGMEEEEMMYELKELISRWRSEVVCGSELVQVIMRCIKSLEQ